MFRGLRLDRAGPVVQLFMWYVPIGRETLGIQTATSGKAQLLRLNRMATLRNSWGKGGG